MTRLAPALRSLAMLMAIAPLMGAGPADKSADRPASSVRMNTSLAAPADPAPAAIAPADPVLGLDLIPTRENLGNLPSLVLVGLIGFLPAAILMFTPFVRIHIALILLRQALGSQQVPGNQVLAALALLLTALIMKPVAETVYKGAVAPFAAHQMSGQDAWEAGSRPLKNFMIAQIEKTGHLNYLFTLHDFAEPGPKRVVPRYRDEYPLRAILPAFLLSELTTALMIGFVLYLPFLVVDLVVSAVLSAMGLFMLPPSLVAMPLKLILFVLADGWLLVATSLLQTFKV
ncbi:flagellar type III secretion system pore protein FliP [Tundrisphaera sp. TA3]|uniref:flagellar type III secretion system pore protein FliP n=1 Tax=Tundrisphaera sp. TA3 TaxID=3435775 RepID=UPI003EBE8CFC